MDGVYAGNLPGTGSATTMDAAYAASQSGTGAAIAGSNSVSAEPVHVQLRWHHQFQFAGYYAAIEKGYYRKAGLEVILHEGAPGKTPIQEVLQGHAQYGEANSELLLERLRGAPLVALASIFQHSPSILLARKDAGILAPEDLIGKKVMMLNQALDADFVAMFNNEGIDISRIQIIPSSYEIQDLVDGKVDAFNSYISNEPYFLKQQGIEYTALNPRNYGVDFYSDILFTSEEEIKRHPERVEAFREASLEGWRYAMEHPQEIIDLLINKYHVSKSRAHLEFEAEAMQTLIFPDLMEMGHMNPWRWQHMAETFIKAGMVENDRLLQGFIYDPDPVADRKILMKYSKISAVFALITSLIAVILYSAYRSVKRENRRRIAIAAELRSRTSELELHNRILRQINQGDPLHAILDELLRRIETLHPGMLCSILLLHEDRQHLQHIAAPSLPYFYIHAIDGLAIGDGIGACGTAAYLGERVIIEDIQQHPYCESIRGLARLVGVQSCWSQPIKNSAGEVLGTFSIYHQQPSRPSDNELALIERYANLVQLVFERKQTENALQSSEERFKSIFNQAPLGIALIDSLTGHIYTANPMFAKIVGRTLEEMSTINWMSITHPDDVQVGLNNMKLLNAGKINHLDMEKRYLHPDGSIVWTKMTIATVETEDKEHLRHLCMIEDITERKKAGEALRESEERLHSIYDLGLIGLAITSPEKGWIRINDYLCKMLEYSESELRGMTWAQLTYPEDLAADVRQFQRLLGNEIDRYALEKRFISRSGKIIPTRLVVQCARKQDGSVNYVTAMVDDITESKQVENTLRESEKQLRFVLEGSQLGFWDWNITTNVVKRSHLWAEILGYTLDEIESTPQQWADLIHPDDQCNAWKSINDHLEGRTPLHELTYRMKTKNGTYRWILDRARIVQRDQDGRPIRMCGTHLDVTEQKNIEDALRESESRFRNLYEKAPLAYQSLSINANILDVNETWLSLLGYSRNEVIGHFIGDFITANSLKTLDNSLECFKKEGPHDGIQFEFVCKNGTKRLLSVNGQIARDSTGNFLRTHCILTDITEIMQAKNAAEAANKAKNQFLANLSHELRTPLNGILGFTGLLQKKSSMSAEDKKQIGIIRQCGENLLTLITDLLDIASIESSKIKLHFKAFDFDALLNNVIDIFNLQADEKNIELIVHNSAVPHLIGDEKRIRQIIVNLLNNAIKYTDHGRVTLTSGYQDGNLNISIEDTGCGIAKHNLQQIFSPFVQINTDDFMKEGVGLGLAITQELINYMGGQLSVTSQPDVGSVFTLSLPLPASEQNQRSVTYQKQTVNKKNTAPHVLIADDNEINLLLLANMLELQGCIVDSAGNGKEALQSINENTYQMAMVDLNMPVMTGLELVRTLRNQHNPLKIAAISAYADGNKITEALAAGFDYYLTKPVSEEQLIKLIQSVNTSND